MEEWGVDLSCLNCKFADFKNLGHCKAFPVGIPYLIVSGSFDHRKIFPNQDNDIIFEIIK